jgi:hypothetical protein
MSSNAAGPHYEEDVRDARSAFEDPLALYAAALRGSLIVAVAAVRGALGRRVS